MDIKEAFKKALSFEEKGHEIYEETANKTKNPVVEKTFRFLADQELNHINDIKRYLEEEKIEITKDEREDPKIFFNIEVKEFTEKTELSKDDLKAHETALDLEKKSYDFYKQEHKKAKDKDVKKFLKFLMDQENSHYELIQKAYEFIKNPTAFYSEEEGWMADGG